MIQDGTWIMNTSADIVQALIDGKGETVCLPRLEFIGQLDVAEFQKTLKEGIKRQGAVFHLYHDGLGRPKRVGNLLFSQDVFLKDLKMTYVGYLRGLGYRFKASKKAAFEDPDYLRDVQSGAYIAEKRQGKAAASKPPADSNGETSKPQAPPSTSPSQPAPTSTSPQHPRPAEGNVQTSWDVMPAGVLHPSIRKAKKELEEKIRQIKSRPYKKEIIQVDPVRWASGRMGILGPDGSISKAIVEGQQPILRLLPPIDRGWLTPPRAKALASQPCEFILFRDSSGRDLSQGGVYPLADVYFIDLGLTWNDWLTAEGLHPATGSLSVGVATGPIVLGIQVIEGTWGALKAPAIAEVNLQNPPLGVNLQELLRVPPPEKSVPDLKAFLQRFNAAAASQPISASMLVCPDGKPYLELGQKRAARILFPSTGKTLAIMMKEQVARPGK